MLNISFHFVTDVDGYEDMDGGSLLRDFTP